jgi:MFS family permease
LIDSCVARRKNELIPQAWIAWLVCLSAGLFFFYEFFQLNLFDVINQSLRDEFEINATQLSWMSSTYVWANVLFLLPAGIILDRFSTRYVILCAMLTCVIGTLGFALTYSFAWASFFHAMTGLGNAFCFLSCVVLISRWFQPFRQALAIGCIVTMAFIGGMMAHTPMAYLNAQYGWRNALLIDAGAGLLILVWLYFIIQDAPPTFKFTPVEQKRWFIDFKDALRNSQNWLAGLYTSCLNLPIMVLCALWGASHLQIAHQLTQIEASNVVTLMFIGSIFGCPLVGWLSDTLARRKPLMVIGAIATLLTLLPLLTGAILSKTTLSIIFFALGLFTSTQVISYPLIAESNPLRSTGVATGIASVIVMGGGGLAQVLFGLLLQRHAGIVTQQYTAADFEFAMWMFPLTVAIALFAILLTRETYCKHSD